MPSILSVDLDKKRLSGAMTKGTLGEWIDEHADIKGQFPFRVRGVHCLVRHS